jgi:O-acetylserine/cysteine efflux transporter
VAVTAVQFLAAALATLPVAAATEGVPAAAAGAGTMVATAGLALVGTLAPATLFAYGQARVAAEFAGAFLNLEPLVGAAAVALPEPEPPEQVGARSPPTMIDNRILEPLLYALRRSRAGT